MSTDRPSDEFGRPLSDAIDRMDRHTERRAARRSHRDDPWARWSARVNEKIAAQRASVRNLASAVGLEFANVHRDFEKRLAAERAARVELERQLADLCGELATARTLADLAARLDRIERVAPPAERTADAARSTGSSVSRRPRNAPPTRRRRDCGLAERTMAGR